MLAAPPLLTGREADFEAFWYFTILIFAMLVLVSVLASWALGSVRGLWRQGNQGLALLTVGAVGFFCILMLAMVLTALIGLTRHAATPGTNAASVGMVVAILVPPR
jgi:hypothetical protein